MLYGGLLCRHLPLDPVPTECPLPPSHSFSNIHFNIVLTLFYGGSLHRGNSIYNYFVLCLVYGILCYMRVLFVTAQYKLKICVFKNLAIHVSLLG